MRRPGCFKSAAAKLEAMAKPHYLDALDAAKNVGYRSHMPSTHTTTAHQNPSPRGAISAWVCLAANSLARPRAASLTMNESLDQLDTIVPDLLIQDCAGCGEHLASRLQSEKLLKRSGLRVIAGKKPSEVRGHDRPYCIDCLNVREA